MDVAALNLRCLSESVTTIGELNAIGTGSKLDLIQGATVVFSQYSLPVTCSHEDRHMITVSDKHCDWEAH